jgi:hypothetical protein
MDKLKQLVASKRKTTEQEFKGKKFVKRDELEQARLQKLREEEEAERKLKVMLCCNLQFSSFEILARYELFLSLFNRRPGR